MKFHTESQHFAPNKIGPPISAVLCAPEYEIFILCPCDSPNDTINENLNCGLPSYDTVSVTQHKSAQSLFILKPGYMFRLKVSHLQALTTIFVTRCFAHFGIP